jgi:YHS domain-containing protein
VTAVAQPLPGQAVDPVCGMTVDVAGARWTTEHGGQTWYFCSPQCREAFVAEHAIGPPG